MEKLNFKIVEEKFNKSRIEWDENHNSIGVTFCNNQIIFEDYINKFQMFTKPYEIQKSGIETSIFGVQISETINLTSYDIYKNGKYFNITFGREDWDLSFFDYL